MQLARTRNCNSSWGTDEFQKNNLDGTNANERNEVCVMSSTNLTQSEHVEDPFKKYRP